MDYGVFGNLLAENQLPLVMQAIEKAVSDSFDFQKPSGVLWLPGVGEPTQAEAKHRAKMCIEMIRILRGDLRWGVQRIVDRLPSMLTKRLKGEEWNPEKERAMWGPNDKV